MELILTPDTQSVLLLFGELGQRGTNGLKPLGIRQYNALAAWLKIQGLRPGDLLTPEGRARLTGFQTAEVNFDRVTPLLERGAALAVVVEKWERSGLWVISRSDTSYPDRLKRYLGQAAPPLLYGVGSMKLLNRGGLAVLGSRDRSEEDGEFARRIGEYCARDGIAVVSGAAKGIDRDAMSGALEAGGWAIGVLAEGLAKTATSGQYRSGLVNDRLTLLSPYDPDSRWFSYAAMERNKILYGLSDAALVVASSDESGGTWSGATEALKLGRVKVFVKSTGAVAPGNSKLLRVGGIPFPPEPWENLQALFVPPGERNGQLFSATPPPPPSAAPTPPAVHPTAVSEMLVAPPPGGTPSPDAYPLVIDVIVTLLQERHTDKLLAEKMCVRPTQMKDWLDRAVAEGRINKLKNPLSYVANSPTLFTD